jgi:hypothetical protein
MQPSEFTKDMPGEFVRTLDGYQISQSVPLYFFTRIPNIALAKN